MSDDLKLAVENLSLKDKVELREYLSDMINSSRRLSKSPLRCSILLGTIAFAAFLSHLSNPIGELMIFIREWMTHIIDRLMP